MAVGSDEVDAQCTALGAVAKIKVFWQRCDELAVTGLSAAVRNCDVCRPCHAKNVPKKI